jgi:hypothetical protein
MDGSKNQAVMPLMAVSNESDAREQGCVRQTKTPLLRGPEEQISPFETSLPSKQ